MKWVKELRETSNTKIHILKHLLQNINHSVHWHKACSSLSSRATIPPSFMGTFHFLNYHHYRLLLDIFWRQRAGTKANYISFFWYKLPFNTEKRKQNVQCNKPKGRSLNLNFLKSREGLLSYFLTIKMTYYHPSLRNQPTFRDTTGGFLAKWHLLNGGQKFHADDMSLPRSA